MFVGLLQIDAVTAFEHSAKGKQTTLEQLFDIVYKECYQ